jgi:phosphatidylinositol alpha-1,6-mannosyltransferase
MKIGLLTSDLSHKHGWAHVSLSMVRALQSLGADVRVVASHNSPVHDDITMQAWLPTVEPPDRYTLPQLLQNVPRVRQYLADCDIIHSTIEPYAPLAASVVGERPLFITAHGSYVYLPQMRRFPIGALYGWAFKRATLACVSHYTARVVHELDADIKTIVVPNAIDASRFDTIPIVRPDERPPTIITVGGVKPRKGTLELVRAVAKVRDVVSDVRCIIIGNTEAVPDYTAKVRAEIERLDLHANVEMVGFVTAKALHQWYASAHIFAMPAVNEGWKFEGYGLVVLEASAAGLPVIGTRDCGVEDAIQHEKTGLLIDQDKLDAELAPAILRLLRDRELAHAFGENGRVFAQSRTWESVGRELMTHYAQALGMG